MTHKVELYVYDLSMGLASAFSQQFTGKHFPGIWHTSIVVYGKEYFFGGGVQCMTPLTTPYGQPVRVIHLGDTQIDQSLFEDFVHTIGQTRFRMDQYNLFENNCNNFTNECSNFLLGVGIPDDILGLPREFFQTPLGQMVKPMIDQMMGGSAHPEQSPNLGAFGGGGMGSGMGGMNNLAQMMNNPLVSQMMNQMMMMNMGGGGYGNTTTTTTTTNNYSTYGSSSSTTSSTSSSSSFKDPLEIYRYNKSNVPQVMTKLKTTNAQFIDDMNGDTRVLNQLEQYLQLPHQEHDKSTLISDQTFIVLEKLLKHTKESDAFPILDLLRLLVLTSKYAREITIGSHKNIIQIIEERFVSQFSSCSMPTQLMVMRLYCNLFDRHYQQHSKNLPEMVQFIIGAQNGTEMRLTKLVDMISTSLSSELEGLRLTATSLSCNLSLYLPQQNSDEEIQLLSSMLEFLPNEKSKDVSFRMLLTIYRLMKDSTGNDDEKKEIARALMTDPSAVFSTAPGVKLLQSSDELKLLAQIKKLL
ncbi:hypothetical protein FDP41_010860 [Naegleria fowleri]|uniref:PPPDE domain-containing protein n=1 Tax=Naegleria fowleri TaxID=5763 RepID=A0A6A5C6Z5_NAEFO|nr:uncharacterized protein FDP41_010860 [Naegleria fowleri]KAF0982881.1 hypothetical protein FDP41_010860 [Naegleria fowleri]CAG4719684.1 unnamed protein product [Naegleria fowleri]